MSSVNVEPSRGGGGGRKSTNAQWGEGGGLSYKTILLPFVKGGSLFCLSFCAPKTSRETAEFKRILNALAFQTQRPVNRGLS